MPRCTSAAATAESTPPERPQRASPSPTWLRIASTVSTTTFAVVQLGRMPAMSCRNRRSTSWPCGECTTSGWYYTPASRRPVSSKADAEHRHTRVEQARVHARGAVGVGARRPAGEDDRRRVTRQQLGHARGVRDDLGVHLRLPDPARDQLRILRPEVDDEHGPWIHTAQPTFALP